MEMSKLNRKVILPHATGEKLSMKENFRPKWDGGDYTAESLLWYGEMLTVWHQSWPFTYDSKSTNFIRSSISIWGNSSLSIKNNTFCYKVSEMKFLILFDWNVTAGKMEKITISVFFWLWPEHTRENIWGGHVLCRIFRPIDWHHSHIFQELFRN